MLLRTARRTAPPNTKINSENISISFFLKENVSLPKTNVVAHKPPIININVLTKLIRGVDIY
jgi:hypothetical protein